jgi:hypothetical protein
MELRFLMVVIKEWGAEIFRKIRPYPIPVRALESYGATRTAVGYLKTNWQRRLQLCQPLFINYIQPQVKYGVRSPEFILAPCAQLYSLAETTQPPPFPSHLGSYTRAYWPAKIDNISLWPPAYSCWQRCYEQICDLFGAMNTWFPECRQRPYECSAVLTTAQRMLRDVGNCAMMPVAILRPVRIHHVFPIHTRSLSSLWALKFQQWVNLSWVAQCSWGGVVVHPSLYLLSCSHNSAIIYHYWKQEGVG